MPWNDETVALLEKLWDEGLTTVKIAEAIGVSKNSVIGKVHRMKLPQRVSPIKKKDATSSSSKKLSTPAKTEAKTNKPVISKEKTKTVEKKEVKAKVETKKVEKIEVEKIEIEKIQIIEEKKPAKVAKISKEEEQEFAAKNIAKQINKVAKIYKEKIGLIELEPNSCRWSFGDPKDETNFHFCGKKVVPGQTYCQEHVEMAYVKQIRR